MKLLVPTFLVLVCQFLNAAEVAESQAQESKPNPSSTYSLSANCKIRNNMPQPGCSDQDLCFFNPTVYSHVCKKLEDQRAKQKALDDEATAIQSATRSSDTLFSVEEECSANPKVLGKGAALASVVPFKQKTVQNADPSVPGWNIVGMGAKEIEISRCRFWFKKR